MPNAEEVKSIVDSGTSNALPDPLSAPGAELRLSVSSLALRLGVAPSTLRTWERRYGIGPSEHVSGRHRRYNRRDVERLDCMRRAIEGGASPAEAARYALNTVDTQRTDADNFELEMRDQHFHVNSVKTESDGVVRELAGAVVARDTVSMHRILDRAIDGRGVPQTWSEVVVPLLDWFSSAGGGGSESAGEVADTSVASLSYCVSSVLATTIVESPVHAGSPRVLLAATPGETADLEMRALAAALARVSVDVRLLTKPISSGSLVSGVADARPDVLVFWLPAREVCVLPLVRAIRRRCSGLSILLAGRGWSSEPLPRTIRSIGGVDTAVDAVYDAVS